MRRIPLAGIPAGRNSAVDSRAGRIRQDRNPGADNPAVDTREPAQTADTPAAGMVVDQANQAAVRVGRQAVRSPVNAPDVVAHEPILSTDGVFLNVPPISVA
ncbi:hypothetical protein MHPYR_20156 [uncultured Mycobacterium sp.]|uniref:Uncharacterized protein n=1 Tax=uncultured Mycobacterium sp. TaxID=171292 RepID=A0A1Y5P7L3_9MYCO|nr:hypothetical protein MHPYR_20156 [uncultured Mycobacterium sp.]